MNAFRALFITFGLALLTSSAMADIKFSATPTHDQETTTGLLLNDDGSGRAESFGVASFNLNDAMTWLTFTATIYNIDVTGTQTPDLNDNLTAAHIHAAAPGVNGGVIWGFFGSPFNDIDPNDFVLTPFADGVGGTFSGKWDSAEGQNTTLALQLPNIMSGNTYINFHTVQYRGGEIRGVITQVPDGGSTIALLGLAVAALCGVRRKANA